MAKPKGSYRVIPSDPAMRDLRKAFDWALEVHRNEVDARKYMALIRTAFKSIEADPFAPPSKKAEEYGAGIRSFHIRWVGKGPPKGHHYVFYAVDPPNTIVVHAVAHEASDLAGHLAKNLPEDGS